VKKAILSLLLTISFCLPFLVDAQPNINETPTIIEEPNAPTTDKTNQQIQELQKSIGFLFKKTTELETQNAIKKNDEIILKTEMVIQKNFIKKLSDQLEEQEEEFVSKRWMKHFLRELIPTIGK
jgi:hypothetical protein